MVNFPIYCCQKDLFGIILSLNIGYMDIYIYDKLIKTVCHQSDLSYQD